MGSERAGIVEAGSEDDRARRRRLAAEVYRPQTPGRLVIVGEAPPPERFFYYGDSLFFRYLRRAFAQALPEVEARDAGWFLAFYRELGGWRIDVCDQPQRASKGGADDVSARVDGFLGRWQAQPLDPEAAVIVSPKRLLPALPEPVRRTVTATVPPPGQWNAHRQAFLREMEGVLGRQIGTDALRAAAKSVDADEAALEFELVRGAAEGADADELRRLVRGHPREASIWQAWGSEPEQCAG